MSQYLLLEDGGKIQTEDASGFLLLEYVIADFVRALLSFIKPHITFSFKKPQATFEIKK